MFSKEEKEDCIKRRLYLSGEEVLTVGRWPSMANRPLKASLRPDGRYDISVGFIRGRPYKDRRSRVKFCLHHGFLPDEVDHINRNHADDSLSNLREASSTLNKHNRQAYNKHGLPRCVSPQLAGGRFCARVSNNKVHYYLGTFDTPHEASAAVEVKLKEIYGEHYTPQGT